MIVLQKSLIGIQGQQRWFGYDEAHRELEFTAARVIYALVLLDSLIRDLVVIVTSPVR